MSGRSGIVPAVLVLVAALGSACIPDSRVSWRTLAPLAVTPASGTQLAHNAALTLTASDGTGTYSFSLAAGSSGSLVTTGLRGNQATYLSTAAGPQETATINVTSGVETKAVTITVPASGTLDTSFGDSAGSGADRKGFLVLNLCANCVDSAKAMAFDENGDLIITAKSEELGASHFALFRVRSADGTLDTTGFSGGTGGIVRFLPAEAAGHVGLGATGDSPLAVHHQVEGGHKYVVGGTLAGVAQTVFFRFNGDGTNDSTFAPGGFFFELPPEYKSAGSAVHSTNGYLGVARSGTSFTFRADSYNQGAQLGSFDVPGSPPNVGDPLLVPLDGSRMMVVGRRDTQITTFARLDFGSTVGPDTSFGTAGVLDVAWGDMGTSEPSAASVEPTTQRVACSGVDSPAPNSTTLYVLAADADATFKRGSAFLSGDQGVVGGLVVQPDNGVIVGGGLDAGLGGNHAYLFRFATNSGFGYTGDTANYGGSGLLFNPLGFTDGQDGFRSLLRMPDGRLVAAGFRTDNGGNVDVLVARFWP